MVYSTCTFNPVEDEAVVAAVLRATKGAMRLVDVSGDLPQLKRLPGMHTWKVRPPRRLSALHSCRLLPGRGASPAGLQVRAGDLQRMRLWPAGLSRVSCSTVSVSAVPARVAGTVRASRERWRVEPVWLAGA